MSDNQMKVKITSKMSGLEVKAFKIMEMYKIISKELIVHLKESGMVDPHPSKEFILDLIKTAMQIRSNECLGYYFWATDINKCSIPCTSTTEHYVGDYVKYITDSDYFYFQPLV